MSATKDPYPGPERRSEYIQWRADVDRRLNDGADTMRGLRADIAANTTLTRSVQANTQDLVALLESFKGAFRVLEMLGKAARPLGYIVALAAAFLSALAAIKGGGSPK